MKRVLSILGALVLAVAVLVPVTQLSSPSPAQAVSGSDFQAGNIISDGNFYNPAAMTVADIQNFLNAREPSCQSGYTCLKSYTQSTYSRGADPMCKAYGGASNESAAQIIFKVQQACSISAKVILVTLEKEQGLVSSTAPSAGRYQIAMGYACPDTAPCDSEYFGFYNQVYKAAWQFKRYGNPAGTSQFFTWIPVGGTANIQYNPNAACGTKPVQIQNAATAALYYYTPYTPNAAALANMYGTGDGCSSYGNRNFFRMYTDWFGPTIAPYSGALDTAVGVYKGIQISGWSYDPAVKQSGGYVWVNIDGQGGPYNANKPLSWFNNMFPGWGNNHGYSETIPASSGPHQVCVYSMLASTSPLIGCKDVVVPYGDGHLDTATWTWGGVRVTGWSVDFSTTAPSYIWINVDGQGGPANANLPTSWVNNYHPGSGVNHGFDTTVKASPGTHRIDVYGMFGPASGTLLGSATVTVPRGTGAFDSVTAVPGGYQVTGWSADYTSPDQSYVWINLDGYGGFYKTNKALSWLPNYLPGIGAGSGFDIFIPASKGTHQLCVYGVGGTVNLGCKSATVTQSDAGALDGVEAVAGGLRVHGWAVDLTQRSVPSYVWIDINGTGTAAKASIPLSWFNGFYAGAGPNHGYDVTIPRPPGTYQVCVTTMSALTPLGCRSVTVR
ncbi:MULTISPECIES: hypothetical protein [unclassified Leifsonia]|uniref:hypothetical protein n=1 Tax=unclassified Leifsonia TaxID=2663824 RepID=UPI000375FBBB|nr:MULTISPECIES: hypothetical protein [unclassified Leifsonia]TDQ02858.1 hypothetical protein AXZ95_1138 [Leifsonia sp. 115AMFTsu3.1]